MKKILLLSILFFTSITAKKSIINTLIKKDLTTKPCVITALVTGTVYHANISQCDNTPFITADMSIIDTSKIDKLRWVALSRNLLKRWNGSFNYGDIIEISTIHDSIKIDSNILGKWIIHDTMNKRFKNKIDFLVPEKSNTYGKWENLKIIKINYKL